MPRTLLKTTTFGILAAALASAPAHATWETNLKCEGYREDVQGDGWHRSSGWSTCTSVGTRGVCTTHTEWYGDTQGGSVGYYNEEKSCTV